MAKNFNYVCIYQTSNCSPQKKFGVRYIFFFRPRKLIPVVKIINLEK